MRPQGILPLELWDFVVGGRTLWEHRDTPEFPDALLEMLLSVRAGRGRTRSRDSIAEACRDFDSIFVGGGASLDETLRARLHDAPFSISFSEEGAFVCEAGGRELLRQLQLADGGSTDMIVDVGQVQIKVTVGEERYVFPRNLTDLPVASTVSPGDVATQRDRLRRFIGTSLRRSIEASGLIPDAIVMALPCELDKNGVPRGCSYAGTRQHATLVPGALRDAGLARTPCVLINDAELAALSARAHPDVDPATRTLVLTLGFGVGAALLAPEP